MLVRRDKYEEVYGPVPDELMIVLGTRVVYGDPSHPSLFPPMPDEFVQVTLDDRCKKPISDS
jgi:hypothetical protein